MRYKDGGCKDARKSLQYPTREEEKEEGLFMAHFIVVQDDRKLDRRDGGSGRYGRTIMITIISSTNKTNNNSTRDSIRKYFLLYVYAKTRNFQLSLVEDGYFLFFERTGHSCL